MTITTTDEAKLLRTALKAKGWNSRKVSVRSSSFSMGSSIDVTIKDASVPMSVVKEIAKGAERIHRCEITGDILSGCNRYVSVNYTREALETLGAPFVAKIREAFESIPRDDDRSCPSVAPGCFINRAHQGIPTFLLRMPECRITLYGADEGGYIEAAAAVAQIVNASQN